MRGTWQTSGRSRAGAKVSGGVLAGIAAVVLAAVAVPAVGAAVAGMLWALFGGLSLLTVSWAGAYVVWRRHRPVGQPPLLAHLAERGPVAVRAARAAALPEPERRALPPAQHIHFHGVSAEDAAAALARLTGHPESGRIE